ncbi:hypothetical protein SAMN05216266_112196 [Amycolatopsis marina]|uniref:DUF308 domain-containing protein n=1 Tax=Amycolatopsis marina TaxID=490629 RepID=A0A1I1B834_9PSEU|nr:hypothetical protein [Amycolatopsis marina]SFB46509.1 hypothetical protein SAMN05216266_112196 [Amycolatopsis marina]
MSRIDGHEGPEDVDAAFARIAADLRAEGIGTQEARERDQGEPDAPTQEERPQEQTRPAEQTSTSGWRDSGSEWDETLFGRDPSATNPEDDDEHFVPPEPPPLPRPRRGAVVILLFFVLSLLLLIAPGILGLSSRVGLPLGILGLTAAIALLLLRVKQGPPDGADPTTGAQV